MGHIKNGARCQAGVIGRPFDPGRDSITVEVRPGTHFNQFWYGKDEHGRNVGGYLQLLSPWPVPEAYAGPYRLKCMMFANPASVPLTPVGGVILHEAGGHGNLVPSGIYEHPSRFASCYPWWRLLAEDETQGDSVGPSVIYGPNGEVLHECGPFPDNEE